VHVVTKILVVFAAILAVLLAGLTMAYSINADSIVSNLRSERMMKDQAITALNSANTRHGEELALRAQEVQALQGQLNGRDERINQLESEVASLRTEKRNAEIEAERLTNQIGDTLDSLQFYGKMIDGQRVEIAQLRDKELSTREEMIQLEDSLHDAESRNEVLTQTTRSLQEQLKELQNQIASAGEGGVAPGGVAIGTLRTVGSLRTIKGGVLDVRSGAIAGQTLVEINVGENDGAEVGMVMAVYRGTDNYVGNIEITRTDLQTSVGRVTLLENAKDPVQNGDRVATNIR
jgi:vacuolar-type H+-ATPase subunit I/STV1